MSEALKLVLENIEQMTSSEKALAAHCLLTSLDGKADEGVDAEWLKIIETRRADYKSGKVQLVDWDEVKSGILK